MNELLNIATKEDAILLFTRRVAIMATNTKLPLLERLNYLKIAFSNMEDYISNRLPKKEGENYDNSVTIIDAILKSISDYSMELHKELLFNNVKADDKNIKLTKGALRVMTAKTGFNLNLDDMIYCIYNTEDNREFYLMNKRDNELLFVPPGYDCFIYKEIRNNGTVFNDKYANVSNINTDFVSTMRQYTSLTADHAFIWTYNLKNIDMFKRIHDRAFGGDITMHYMHPYSLDLFKSYKKAKKKNRTLEFEPITSYKYKVDYGSALLSDNLTSYLYRTPFESFSNIESFIYQMCTNTKVKYIQMTLYRMAAKSNIVKSLLKAVRLGKEVDIYIEVGARGNEKANYAVIDILELHSRIYENLRVNYKFNGFKVHAKMFIAHTDDQIITHTATGNYNEDTAKQYIDLHYITNDPRVGRLCTEIMSSVMDPTNAVIPHEYIYDEIIRRIDDQAALGPEGRIRMQCNHLNESSVIDALNRAVEAGSKVELIIRTTIGHGIDTRIPIKSLCGRFLEHSRSYIFGDGRKCIAYIGSCDLLQRNLFNRMETLIPVNTRDAKTYLCTLFDGTFNNKEEL